MRAVGTFDVFVTGLGEAQPVAVWRPRNVHGFTRLESAVLCPEPQDAERPVERNKASRSHPLEVGDPSPPPCLRLIGAEPAESDEHIDRRDILLAGHRRAGRGHDALFEAPALGHRASIEPSAPAHPGNPQSRARASAGQVGASPGRQIVISKSSDLGRPLSGGFGRQAGLERAGPANRSTGSTSAHQSVTARRRRALRLPGLPGAQAPGGNAAEPTGRWTHGQPDRRSRFLSSRLRSSSSTSLFAEGVSPIWSWFA